MKYLSCLSVEIHFKSQYLDYCVYIWNFVDHIVVIITLNIHIECILFAEDTLTLYTEKEYAGFHTTIIEDIVNVTFSAGPLSAMVTG